MKIFFMLLVVVLISQTVHVHGYCDSNDQCMSLAEQVQSQAKFSVDDRVSVFLFLKNSTTTRRGAFFPKVDDFARFEIPGSGQIFHKQNANLTLQIVTGAGVVESEPRIYQSTAKGFAAYFQAVVRVDNGVITAIDWDDDCTRCEVCLGDKTCGYEYTSVDIANGKDPMEDVKVYFAWIGDDSNGDTMTSSGQIISRLREFAIADSVSDVATSVGTTVEEGQNKVS